MQDQNTKINRISIPTTNMGKLILKTILVITIAKKILRHTLKETYKICMLKTIKLG